jgi:hypothetical protein
MNKQESTAIISNIAKAIVMVKCALIVLFGRGMIIYPYNGRCAIHQVGRPVKNTKKFLKEVSKSLKSKP